MKKRALLPLLLLMILLILDSRCAADSARDAMELCIRSLIPGLFPMFVLSAMLVPHLSGIRIPALSRFLGIPAGSEGIFLLGCAGGFPVGAACIVQAVQSGGLDRENAGRMLGISSFCGPAFLFGVLGNVLGPDQAVLLFLIQLESALILAPFWPWTPGNARSRQMDPVTLPKALKRATTSLASVCAWVTLAGVAAGFLGRWLAPLLPAPGGVVLTGLLELTNGVFAAAQLESVALRFVLCAGFVCFGGVSVLLQIAGLAGEAGLPMTDCLLQKTLQGILGVILAAGCLSLGPVFLPVAMLIPAGKIAVEISGGMVYNGRRKEGI